MEPDHDLFGNPVRDPARLTVGGYPYKPGTGPAGQTCKTCANAYCKAMGKNYWKCRLVRATSGPGSDIRLKSPACRAWRVRAEADEA